MQNHTTTLQLQEFVSEDESLRIRALDIEGEQWFVARDICDALEISNSGNAILRLDGDEVRLADITDASMRVQQMRIVNESGLYALILRSDKPKAKVFRKWVTGTVLPQIRRTGSFNTAPPSAVDHPVTLFFGTIDGLRSRGISGEKACYSAGQLFQSAVAGALTGARNLLPVRIPDPPVNLPPVIAAPRPVRNVDDPDWTTASGYLASRGLMRKVTPSTLIAKAKAACQKEGIEPRTKPGKYGRSCTLFPIAILESIVPALAPKHFAKEAK